MSFDYSIVIRTLGNTGDKYLRMLKAIDRQTVRPQEILVVIPEGYTLDHSLGNERIIRSAKGMVTQRAVGIAEAKGEYLLVLDDDLDFPPDFAEKMHQHLLTENLDCVLAFGGWNPDSSHTETLSTTKTSKHRLSQQIKRLRSAYTGQAFYCQKQSPYFDTIVSTGGHRTYINCEDGLCQTGAFACFFIKADKAKAIHFEEEIWLEHGSISNYAAYDDAVFYYKFFLQGGRIAYTHDTDYLHLDAAAGRPATDKLSAKRIRLYTIAKNRTIFWYRHIWSNRHSFKNLFGGWYGIINYAIYNIIANLNPKYWPAIAAMFKGYGDAYKHIRKK